MKSWVRLMVLTMMLVFVGSAAMGDFYVIPVKTGKKDNGAVPARTGQDTCYRSAEPWGICDECGTTDCPSGQDGDPPRGVAWPNPRFTDNGNGTVRDNLTGLLWTQNADCEGTMTWGNALTHCNALKSGDCGLSDGSAAGDWRLPNRRELESLVDLRYYHPAMPNTAGTEQASEGSPFSNLQAGFYWSSSTFANEPYFAWYVGFADGGFYHDVKTSSHFVRCVR